MWWRRCMFTVVVLGCVANLVLAQHHEGGVPLPALPPQLPSGGATLSLDNGGGVPLPTIHSSGVPTPGIGRDRELPPVVVATQHQGGVPLPPIPAGERGGAGGFQDDPVFVVPLEHGATGVPLPNPAIGGVQGTVGVPLPPPYDIVGAGSPGAQPPTTDISGAPGGVHHVHDPHTDATVQRVLGLAAVRDHVQLKTRADKAVKITDVVTAHKQVVTGQVVYLTLRAGETNCPVGTPDLTGCPLDRTEDSYVCEVVVWERPWLNSSKVIEEKSRCTETEDDNDFNSWGFHSPLNPSPSEVPVQSLPAGVTEQQLGLEAFNYVDRGSESRFRGEMVNFNVGNIMYDRLYNTTRAQVNVEYGFNMCLKSPDQATDPRVCPRDTQRDHYICSVYIVHNPNQISMLEVIPILDETDDHEIKCERKRSVEEELVVPVRAPCLGCPQPAPLNDPTILEIADFALKEYDRTADDDDLHMILRLMKAHSQVTSGVKYYLTIELAETECKKILTGVDVNRTFCNQDLSEETKICDLHVVDQPWVPTRDLVAAQCYDKDNYPSSSQDEFIVPIASIPLDSPVPFQPQTPVLGSQGPLQIDENAISVAQMIVAEYNRREDDREYYKFVKVLEGTTNTVSGVRVYRTTVEMAETNCDKFDPTLGNGEHCFENPREEHEVCSAEVHEQGARRQIVHMSCQDLDDYLRDRLMPTLNSFDIMDHPFINDAQAQSASGNSVPTADPKVQEVAAFVVGQYNLRGDEDELYVLSNVVSARSQPASGMTKYYLEIELAETYCKKYLPISDPSRCMIDYSEDREICQAEVNELSDATKQLTRLYCDERDDYFTSKLRGKFFPGASHQQLGAGSTLTGSWVAANVNDSSIKKLGHLIADEFDLRSDEDNLFIFHRLVRAQKMVTSGLKYHLLVELLETVCPKYKRRIDKTRCLPDIGEDHMMCEAEILIQPWLSKQEVKNLHCAEKDDFLEGDDSVEVLLPRVHPSAHARPIFRSHFVERTSDESEESNERFYEPLRRFSSRRRESNEDFSNETVERFYHPSGGRNSHHDTDEDDDSDEFPNFRGRRATPGGFSDGDVNDPYIKEIADFAIKSIDSLAEDPRVRIVENIVGVQKQVVSGINYRLELTVSYTNCLKADEVEDVSACSKDTSEQSRSCTVVVYDVPWRGIRKVSDSSCSPIESQSEVAEEQVKRSRRGTVGGYTEGNPNDPVFKPIADFAVAQMDEASDDRYVRRVESIQSAATQVVAGLNYKLNITISWTTCLKADNVADVSSCPTDNSRPVMTCEVIVWDKPWQNFRQLSSYSCN